MDAATIVQRIRASSGITRREIAALTGVSPSTIGRIESGQLDPTWGMLSRILEATGFRISGNTIISSGDTTAAAAARGPLERALGSLTQASTQSMAVAPAHLPDTSALGDSMTTWLKRWSDAGWLSDRAGTKGLITMATAAGNASKLVRRDGVQRYIGDRRRWQELARRIGAAGSEYAVSGLLAVREDRTTATSLTPLIYVNDPNEVVRLLDAQDSTPGQGVLLLETSGHELVGSEMDDGILFTSPAQAFLDALAGSGREPDKADSLLRSMLETSS